MLKTSAINRKTAVEPTGTMPALSKSVHCIISCLLLLLLARSVSLSLCFCLGAQLSPSQLFSTSRWHNNTNFCSQKLRKKRHCMPQTFGLNCKSILFSKIVHLAWRKKTADINHVNIRWAHLGVSSDSSSPKIKSFNTWNGMEPKGYD